MMQAFYTSISGCACAPSFVTAFNEAYSASEFYSGCEAV